MKERDQYDISRSSFDEFVDFLFKHDVVPLPEGPDRDKKPEPWYWHADVTFDARRVLTFYIQLFENPEFLLKRYTKEQLEQGFWAIISGNIECSVTEVIWDKEVPFDTRAACVRSMYHLFERFFLKEPLETSSNMWWDALAYDWDCDNRSRANGGEDESMQDVMYETLERILVLPNEACQAAALHGIGHLHHPNTPETIQRFLTREISPELRDYALAAGRFEIM